MKLFTADNSELMSIDRIETENSALAIRGTIMGAMPIDVVLTGTEMRKAVRLLNVRVILTVIRMLLSKTS